MFDEKLPQGNNSVTLKTKILLADDDTSIRRFLEIILQRINYDVTASKTVWRR